MAKELSERQLERRDETVEFNMDLFEFVERKVRNMRYENMSDKDLYRFFETNEIFNLPPINRKEICCEIVRRINNKNGVPAAEVDLKAPSNSVWDGYVRHIGVGLSGVTDFTGEIVLYLPTKAQFEKSPPRMREKLGMEYLFTLIHEARHSQQDYFTSKFVANEKIKGDMAFIVLQNIQCKCLEDINKISKKDYKLNLMEHDANAFAIDVIMQASKDGLFINGDTAIKACLPDLLMQTHPYYSKAIVDSKVNYYHYVAKQFGQEFPTALGLPFSYVYKRLDAELLRKSLIKSSTRFDEILKKYYNHKVEEMSKKNSTKKFYKHCKDLLEGNKINQLYYASQYIDLVYNSEEQEQDAEYLKKFEDKFESEIKKSKIKEIEKKDKNNKDQDITPEMA